MKLTKSHIKQLIKEELQKVLQEYTPEHLRNPVTMETKHLYQILKDTIHRDGVLNLRRSLHRDEMQMLKQLSTRAGQGDTMAKLMLRDLGGHLPHDLPGGKPTVHPIAAEARQRYHRGMSSWQRGADVKGPRRDLTGRATGKTHPIVGEKGGLRRSTGKSPRAAAMKLSGPAAGASTLSRALPWLFAAITINGLRREMEAGYAYYGGGSDGVLGAIEYGKEFLKREAYDVITLKAPRAAFSYLADVAKEAAEIERKSKKSKLRYVAPKPSRKRHMTQGKAGGIPGM